VCSHVIPSRIQPSITDAGKDSNSTERVANQRPEQLEAQRELIAAI
jgi:hypothetical protein